MRSPSNKPGLLTLTIKDKSALYLAYMPFVKNGGLFIPTNSNYRLGDEVFMLLNLMGEEEKLPVAGRVIWMTPKGAQGKRTAGIGVQFSDQDRGNTQKKSRIISPAHWAGINLRTPCKRRRAVPGRAIGCRGCVPAAAAFAAACRCTPIAPGAVHCAPPAAT